MKILTGSQIRDADRYTVENEPVESLALMERAAEAMAEWICKNVDQSGPLIFLTGKGNNGGDGLAMARMLYHAGFECEVYMVAEVATGAVFGVVENDLSPDCRYNLERLPAGLQVKPVSDLSIGTDAVIVDAMLGSGVKGEVSGLLKDVIEYVNTLPNRVIAIDIPSGMTTEDAGSLKTVMHADTTLTIQFPKLAMLLPESGEAAGEIVVIDIGLSDEFIEASESVYHYVDQDLAASLIKPRIKFAHKGTYGHALLICGSEGMAGAAVLATGAALRSGCGLVTTHIPKSEREAIHITNPSAIVSCDNGQVFSEMPQDIDKYDVIGVGPGIGTAPETKEALGRLLRAGRPMVIDADAINLIAADRELLAQISDNSVLTPHVGELRRLLGEWGSDNERNKKVAMLARQTHSVVVVKGAHTMICTPAGEFFFNSTGNSGMAKGGSGDVLTGYLAGLMSRGYAATDAALLAVYVHGSAGDKAAEYFGVEGMNSQDIIDFLGEAMAELSR